MARGRYLGLNLGLKASDVRDEIETLRFACPGLRRAGGAGR